MKLNRTINVGGTGLRPVVSGVAPETGDAAGNTRPFSMIRARRRNSGKIRRDAGFDRRDACSTFSR
jgi:hypothetical protein